MNNTCLRVTIVSWLKRVLRSENSVLYFLALVQLVILLTGISNYGFFRDELYYMACGENLDFGYVDHPPLVPFVAALSRALWGDSLFAVRLLTVLAGSLAVVITGLTAKEMGGGRYAQSLASLAFMIAFIGTFIKLGTDGFNIFLWTLGLYIFVLIVKYAKPSHFIMFGLVAGIGILNKYSVIYLLAGLFLGLLVTQQRKIFLNKWLWIAGGIAFLFILPNLLWQMNHGWPFLEFSSNINADKMAWIPPQHFLYMQFLVLDPVNSPIWIGGLFYLLFFKGMKPFRFLGLSFVIVLAALLIVKGKPYYLAPAALPLLSSGALLIDRGIQKVNRRWLKTVVVLILAAGGSFLLPYSVPVLPLDAFITYSNLIHIDDQFRFEEGQRMKLPQDYADMFGWPEMAGTVAKVYHQLPGSDKEQASILAKNYGEAGAIDFFGKKLGLPAAVSGHVSYFIWGPRGATGDVVITVGKDFTTENLEAVFEEVELLTVFKHDYAIFYETNVPIHVCRKLRIPMEEFWPRLKAFD